MSGQQRQEKILRPTGDIRLLPHVEDPWGRKERRRNREWDQDRPVYARFAGQRFTCDCRVRIHTQKAGNISAKCLNLSQTGMLVEFPETVPEGRLRRGDRITVGFHVRAGQLPEGAEGSYSRIESRIVRLIPGRHQLAVRFDEPLYVTRRRVRDPLIHAMALLGCGLSAIGIVLLRVHRGMQKGLAFGLLVYAILTGFYLLTRYLFAMMYHPAQEDPTFTPTVTVVIPCYNEERWIQKAIVCALDQDYPPDRLELIVVDDGSTDRSARIIRDTLNRLHDDGDPYHVTGRVRVFFQRSNQGKRQAMALGIENAQTDLVLFADSDSFMAPDAVRQIVQPFRDKKIGGVCGRTDVANVHTGILTRMQSVRYTVSFRIFKAAECCFDAVTCLSGPLACYRRSVLESVRETWLEQRFMGRRATFGDDRSLTNLVLRNHQTFYQDTAVCRTIVPSGNLQFLKQQMRWKRSWVRESARTCSFIWRRPLAAIFFYLGFLIPLLTPGMAVYHGLVLPVLLHRPPVTYLLSPAVTSLMAGFACLFLRYSSHWIYSLLYGLYYELVLIWQIPWAVLTFWKDGWGTRGERKVREKAPRRVKKKKHRKKHDVMSRLDQMMDFEGHAREKSREEHETETEGSPGDSATKK